MTADELLHLHLPGKRSELIRGRLVVREPAGYRHGEVAMAIGSRVFAHVKVHDLGRVFAAETGFRIESAPDTVRAPDVAFIAAHRVPVPSPEGFPSMAPDLAVEVLSPGDRPGQVLEKVADWLNAGVRLVWVVDPGRRVARVYRADGTQSLLVESDAMDGEDVLSGFSCVLAEVL